MSGERKALIIANDEYDHEGLRRLLASAADAEALGRVLGDPQIGGFDVEVVHNQPSHVIYGRIEELFVESRRDDVLLLYFSCHGLKSESGELFFAARNTRPKLLGATAVAADFVQRCMRTSRSRSIVLLLDCSYGGAFSQGVNVRASGDVDVLESFPVAGLGGGRGRAVITAFDAMEYAFEADALADDHTQRPSVFTRAVTEGLATGEADRDEDGWVSLNELYDYVFDRVREQNPNQTPSRHVEMQGELYLARSQRRRIRPRPIPADLEAARTAADMYARLGAVGELRSRLASDNLEAAVGAYEALADLAHNDIEYVAERARAALREVSVQPAQTEVHFGRIAQGSPSPHRTITLLGPPIARACTPRASHDWIRASPTIEGVDISLDTTRSGLLRGSVELKGPTGEAAVTIDVDLFPQELQAPAPATPPQLRLDDDVQFTVYRPSRVQPDRWYQLLAFAHRTTLIEDTDGNVVDPVDVVERQARALLGDERVSFDSIRADASTGLLRGSELHCQPWLEAGEVNPTSATFQWLEPVHRAEFRIRLPASAVGRSIRGGVRVFVGVMIVGEIPFRLQVTSMAPATVRLDAHTATRRYRQIFASYSRRDAAVVEAVARYVSVTGDRYLIDVQNLRSGELWEPRLEKLIEQADIFQLFWSQNSMRSQFVRQEWEYALALGRGEFVRPVYWDDPIPEDSTLGLPPRALRALHFSKLAVDVAPPLAVDVAPPSAPPAAPASLPEAPADPAASRMSRPGPLLIRITIAIVVALVVIALVVTLLRWPG